MTVKLQGRQADPGDGRQGELSHTSVAREVEFMLVATF